MTVQAKLSYLGMSPKKVKLVADVVRNLPVTEAEEQLMFLNKKAAKPILQLLKSAVANAEHNKKLKKENLVIEKLLVNEGPTAYRWMPKAYGRATPIRKKTAHILISLAEINPTAGQKGPAKNAAEEKKDEFGDKVIMSGAEIRDSLPAGLPKDSVVKSGKKPFLKREEKRHFLKRVFKGRAKDKKDNNKTYAP